ncbi:MAG: prepilin-type N-terminal cleavage/methylation domain-containing protein [Burkholderiaceae bacterium]|nr:prepilin-type N-terminal cleavage/methylation domain-containing protein [Burkholderiaceae bacterium]
MTHRPHGAGFTLLELLVVLSIVALTAGLMLPSASRWIEAARERGWRDDLRAGLMALPVLAFQKGEPMVLDADAIRALAPSVPDSVQIRLSKSLAYSANGVAGGVELTLRPPGGKPEVWIVEPITGLVRP